MVGTSSSGELVDHVAVVPSSYLDNDAITEFFLVTFSHENQIYHTQT